MHSMVNKNTFLLAILLFASLSFAFTAEEEAAFFTHAGETSSAREFGTYAVVLVNNVEHAFLKKSGSGFIILESDAELQAAASAYSQEVFEKDLKPNLANLDTAFAALNHTVATCTYGSMRYSSKTRGGVYAALNIRNDGFHFPYQYAAIKFIDGNVTDYNAKLNASAIAVATLKASLSNRDSALAAAEQARTALLAISEKYPLFRKAYENASTTGAPVYGDPYAYFWQTREYPCDTVAKFTVSFNAVMSLISDSKYTPESVLLASVKDKMSQRLSEAKQKRTARLASEVAGQLGDRAKSVKDKFSSLGVQLTGLDAQISAVANSAGSANFETASKDLEADIAAYNTIYVHYNNTAYSLSKADEAQKKNIEKYGTTDDRINSINKRLADVRTSLKQNEELIKAGNVDAVKLSELSQNATALKLEAETLPPKEGQLDFVTIGGIVALVAIGGGAIWYFKKKRNSFGANYNPPSGKTETATLDDLEKL